MVSLNKFGTFLNIASIKPFVFLTTDDPGDTKNAVCSKNRYR